MIRKLPVMLSCCLAGLIASHVNAQPFTVSIEIQPGTVITGGARVNLEVFITNGGADFDIGGYQIELPCDLPVKPGASSGSVRAQPAAECLVNADCPTGVTCNLTPNPNVCNSASVGNTSSAASGSIPFVFGVAEPNNGATGCGGGGCGGGLKPINQTNCRFAGSPEAGAGGAYILPGLGNPFGNKRYMGTVAYDVSDCAAGTFNAFLEVKSTPCNNLDLSRVVDTSAAGNCVSFTHMPTAVILPLGQCCNSTTNLCDCDAVNQFCCEGAGAVGRPASCDTGGNKWTAGRTCADACACSTAADCDDGQFCNGAETCNAAGVCVAGVAPVCPGTTACANGVCNPAANGGAGGCQVVNKPGGTACSIGGEGNPQCDNPDTCNGSGVCQENLKGIGTPCGSSSSGDCDAADSCNGAGACDTHTTPNGGACPDDGNTCTDDSCQGGVCVHTNDNTNPCDDTQLCTDNDRCLNGACIGDPADAVGARCDDALVCTLDSCDTADGSCINMDINQIPCLSDADCPAGSPCGGATCECVEFPDCILTPHKDANGGNCHDAGDLVTVDMEFGGTPLSLCIAGGQFRVVYDPTCLDFVSANPGDAPWTFEYFEQVNETTGVIFYGVGSPVGGPGMKCTNLPGTMATFTFLKIGKCNECNLCLSSVNPQITRLVTQKGQEVTCAELGCTKTIFDDGEITSNCPPEKIDVNSDCKQTTANVSWDPISFDDQCDGELLHTCTCVHEPLVGAPMPDCRYLADHGGIFPQGSFTFRCSATGVNCDELKECAWTVNVSDQQSLHVVLQLSPIIDPFSTKNPDGDFTRCICFELFSSCSPRVMTEDCETIEFGGPFQFPGKAETDVKIDKGKYFCITARDRQHSLRSSSSLTCLGGVWSAEFKGEHPVGNWLIQGNLNRDHVIDILDFGTFLGQFNQNHNPGPDKTCEDNNGLGFTHADFNGDGIVDVADFSFIQINFLEDDKDLCCPDPSAGAAPGRTEVSVKDLREMGLAELAVADLNNDGIVNTDDMASFVQGVRPKTDKAGRGAVGRPSTIRGSR